MKTARRGKNFTPEKATALPATAASVAWMCSGCEAQVTFVYPTTLLKNGKAIAAHFRSADSGHDSGCKYGTAKNIASATPNATPSVFRIVGPRLVGSATHIGPGAPGKKSQGSTIKSGTAGGAGRTATTLALIAQHWHNNQSGVFKLPLAIPKCKKSTYGAIFTSLQFSVPPIKTGHLAIYYSDFFKISSTQSAFTFEFLARGTANRAAKAYIPKNLLTDQYEQLLTDATKGLKVTLYLCGQFIDCGAKVVRLDLDAKQCIHVEP